MKIASMKNTVSLFLVSILLSNTAQAAKLVRLNSEATLVDEDVTPMQAGQGFQYSVNNVNTSFRSCTYRSFAESCPVDAGRRRLQSPSPSAPGQPAPPSPSPSAPSQPAAPSQPVDDDTDLVVGFSIARDSSLRMAIGESPDGLDLLKLCDRTFSQQICSDGDTSFTPGGTTKIYVIEEATDGSYLEYDVTDEEEAKCDICLKTDSTVGGPDANNLEKCVYDSRFPEWLLVPNGFGELACVEPQPCEELEVVQSCDRGSRLEFAGIYTPVDSSQCIDDFLDRSRTLYKGPCRETGSCNFIWYDTDSDYWYQSLADQEDDGLYQCYTWSESPLEGFPFPDLYFVGYRFAEPGASEPFLDLNPEGTIRCCNNDNCRSAPFEIKCNKFPEPPLANGSGGGGSDGGGSSGSCSPFAHESGLVAGAMILLSYTMF